MNAYDTFVPMLLPVYSTSLRLFRLFPIALCALLLGGLGACSKKKHPPVALSTNNDAGDDFDGGVEIDAAGLPQVKAPDFDASAIIPGDPPPELAGQSCAVDTNKLYELVTTARQPEPAALGIDQVGSRFAVSYVDKSTRCVDAVFVTELQGPSGLGTPESKVATDACTAVDHVAVAHAGDTWLLASVDARQDERDLWMQPYDGVSKYPPQRITKTATTKSEVAVTSFGTDAALVSWVEHDAAAGTTTLYARALTALGEPRGDSVAIEQSPTLGYDRLSLSQIGKTYVGLGYRRFDMAGRSELVLQVLDGTTGKLDRDEWLLTKEAGALGSIAISADENGGGLIYSLIQGTSEQLWFQQLGADGRAAPVMSGGRTGGPSDPTRVVGPPYNAVDASLAKLPVGFAVAYRALPGGNVSSARIRVHFLDRFGRVIGNSDVALAQQSGGRTAIGAGYDGRVVLAWSDQTEDGKTTLTAIKLPCVGGA
jgi:hypothetical protein